MIAHHTPSRGLAALLALLTGCTNAVTTGDHIYRTTPRVVQRSEPTPVETVIRARAEWTTSTEGDAVFNVTALGERTCETVVETEYEETHVVERRPESKSLLALDYAIGIAGLSLLGLATYQHFGQHKKLWKKAPTSDDPDNQAATATTWIGIAGAVMSALLYPAVQISVRSRDTKTALGTRSQRAYSRAPCEPGAPLALHTIELLTDGLRYKIQTDEQGKAALSASTLQTQAARAESTSQQAPQAQAYLDGVPNRELMGLVPALREGLRASPVGLARRCSNNDYAVCRELAQAYAQGANVERDLARAASLYEQACSGKDALGCYEFGRAAVQGLGMAPAPARAIGPLELACEGGEPSACTMLGYLIQRGEGIESNQPRALALYERGCREGDYVGCHNLARQYLVGQGVSRSPARAAALYRTACEAGMGPSCHALAELAQRGQARSDNAARVELYRKGCSAGYAPSCEAATALSD